MVPCENKLTTLTSPCFEKPVVSSKRFGSPTAFNLISWWIWQAIFYEQNLFSFQGCIIKTSFCRHSKQRVRDPNLSISSITCYQCKNTLLEETTERRDTVTHGLVRTCSRHDICHSSMNLSCDGNWYGILTVRVVLSSEMVKGKGKKSQANWGIEQSPVRPATHSRKISPPFSFRAGNTGCGQGWAQKMILDEKWEWKKRKRK